MDGAQLGKIERGETREPSAEVLQRIAVVGLGMPVATIAPPDYYTVAQIEAAKEEVRASRRLTDDEKREALASLDAQLRAIRSKGRTG